MLTTAYIHLALLGHLQSPTIISHGNTINAILPSREPEYPSLSNDKQGRPNPASQCTYIVQDATEGLWHVTQLLSMLVDISLEAASSYDATPAFQDYLAWLLDSFLLTHELQKRLRNNPNLRQSETRLEILSFCALHALLSSLRDSLSPLVLRKGYVLLSILCADLLENPSSLSGKSILLSFCSSLINLTIVCNQHQSVRRVVSLHLVAIVKTALTDEGAIATLGKDFKVLIHLGLLSVSILTIDRKSASPCATQVGQNHPRSQTWKYWSHLKTSTFKQNLTVYVVMLTIYPSSRWIMDLLPSEERSEKKTISWMKLCLISMLCLVPRKRMIWMG